MDADLETGRATRACCSRLGGGASRRLTVDWVSFSYSTDVLLGTIGCFRTPEAQASLGFMLVLLVLLVLAALVSKDVDVAAWLNALTMLTDVSRTLHFSGGGLMAVGPTVRDGCA